MTESSAIGSGGAGAGREVPWSGRDRRAPRVEGIEKVTGAAIYTSDVALPRQLYAGILRSRHAHARVRHVDAGPVRSVPGVVDVMTAGDVEGVTWYDEKTPVFAGIARFVGDELAAVVAESEETVAEALGAFGVDYEPLPGVYDIASARREGAPQVHDGATGNLASEPDVYERGDIDEAFAAADVVVEATFTTQCAVHNALEPHGATAVWADGRLEIFTSTQGLFAVRDDLADKLGLPADAVRIRAEHIGGGFGAKQTDWKPTLIAALLARRTGRPVRLMLDRVAENLAVGNRGATRQRVRIGARHDGRLTGIAADIDVAIGAYGVAGESSLVAGCFQHLYDCPAVRTEQRRIYTNTGPAVAFRGPGYVEGLFALEQVIDELASRLGIEPLELRRRNYAEHDRRKGLPYSSPGALEACYESLEKALAPLPPSGNDRKKRGRGLAAGVWVAGGPIPPADVRITIDADGKARIRSGTQDIGTGTRTAIGCVAAELLGLPLDDIVVEIGDTVSNLKAPTSAGSASLPTLAPALQIAAARLGDTIIDTAAARLGVPSDVLRFEQGRVRTADGSQSVSLTELARSVPPQTLRAEARYSDRPDDVAIRTFVACSADVEVDLDTAEITVLGVVCAPDCGRIVNRTLVDSQVIGGVTQGIGFALLEERVVDNLRGSVLNANLEDYLVPTVADVPPITHAEVDLPDLAVNALGIKGIGEPPIIAVAPAIANAVSDALGVRLRELPLNRRRLVGALGAGDGA